MKSQKFYTSWILILLVFVIGFLVLLTNHTEIAIATPTNTSVLNTLVVEAEPILTIPPSAQLSPVARSTPLDSIPNGKIAFISMTDKEHGEPGIIVMDLRTLKSEKVYDLYLGNNPNLGPIWDISWSPDGTMLALSDGRNMVSINVNNGKKDNLTYSPANIGDISELHWSPARDYIVYTERKYQDYGMTSDFVLFELQGSNSRKNTFTDGNESHPTWSPTGDEIAFVYEDEILNAVVPNNPEATEKLEQQQYRNIYTMSRDGKEKRKIFEASSRITSLAWSPKGNELVFTSEEKHCGSLYVVTIDGQKLRKLNTLGCSESPSWSPDGRYIIYVGRIGQDSYRWDGKWQIYIMDSLSNEITQLTNDSKWTPFVPVWSR